MTNTLPGIFAFMKGPLFAAIGTSAFSVLFGLRFADAILASGGAALGWIIMQVMPAESAIAFSVFAASFGSGLYSELVARFRHRPATVYMISSIIPLVPG
ncbi:MAG: threonine/serine exporter family protein, partial [Spirochaetaceae bacterium]|nr:threonine/serine exporter family protein [Spirochaetaceae bacterium]